MNSAKYLAGMFFFLGTVVALEFLIAIPIDRVEPTIGRWYNSAVVSWREA